LELGPGDYLFAGEVLLGRGCQSYAAIDAFRLASVVPQGVQYLIDSLFRVDQAVGEKRFDRFLSCAAFEHFDDVADTLRRLTKTAKPGALLSILVDFKTHSRWIREVDPNNIYRYPDWLYRLFHFRGQPNRVRPNQYVKILKALGWTDIALTSVESASSRYLGRTSAHVSRTFLSDDSDLGVLVGIITARFDPLAN
jgi:cyclopropane fatty-acyl-phospholipid synthase-like methyltransferase